MGKHILIAEDDEAIARLVKASLEKAGHQAHVALDGRLAMQALDDSSFDFVVLDLLMPYYDGSEVLRKIRTTDATKNIPVVILATCPPSEADELIAAYAWSPTKFIRKPFNPKELLAVVNSDAA